jgi:hypothetical protein
MSQPPALGSVRLQAADLFFFRAFPLIRQDRLGRTNHRESATISESTRGKHSRIAKLYSDRRLFSNFKDSRLDRVSME